MLHDFMNLYFRQDSPPIKVDPADGILKRHSGGQHRCAFWAGYDELRGGIFPPPASSANGKAYKAGIAYRKAVDAGKREALPEA